MINNAQNDWREDYHRLKIIERQERERYNVMAHNPSSGQPRQQNTIDYTNRSVMGGAIDNSRYHSMQPQQQGELYLQRQSQQPVQQPLLTGVTHQEVFHQQDKERVYLEHPLHSAQITSFSTLNDAGNTFERNEAELKRQRQREYALTLAAQIQEKAQLESDPSQSSLNRRTIPNSKRFHRQSMIPEILASEKQQPFVVSQASQEMPVSYGTGSEGTGNRDHVIPSTVYDSNQDHGYGPSFSTSVPPQGPGASHVSTPQALGGPISMTMPALPPIPSAFLSPQYSPPQQYFSQQYPPAHVPPHAYAYGYQHAPYSQQSAIEGLPSNFITDSEASSVLNSAQTLALQQALMQVNSQLGSNSLPPLPSTPQTPAQLQAYMQSLIQVHAQQQQQQQQSQQLTQPQQTPQLPLWAQMSTLPSSPAGQPTTTISTPGDPPPTRGREERHKIRDRVMGSSVFFGDAGSSNVDTPAPTSASSLHNDFSSLSISSSSFSSPPGQVSSLHSGAGPLSASSSSSSSSSSAPSGPYYNKPSSFMEYENNAAQQDHARRMRAQAGNDLLEQIEENKRRKAAQKKADREREIEEEERIRRELRQIDERDRQEKEREATKKREAQEEQEQHLTLKADRKKKEKEEERRLELRDMERVADDLTRRMMVSTVGGSKESGESLKKGVKSSSLSFADFDETPIQPQKTSQTYPDELDGREQRQSVSHHARQHDHDFDNDNDHDNDNDNEYSRSRRGNNKNNGFEMNTPDYHHTGYDRDRNRNRDHNRDRDRDRDRHRSNDREQRNEHGYNNGYNHEKDRRGSTHHGRANRQREVQDSYSEYLNADESNGYNDDRNYSYNPQRLSRDLNDRSLDSNFSSPSSNFSHARHPPDRNRGSRRQPQQQQQQQGPCNVKYYDDSYDSGHNTSDGDNDNFRAHRKKPSNSHRRDNTSSRVLHAHEEYNEFDNHVKHNERSYENNRLQQIHPLQTHHIRRGENYNHNGSYDQYDSYNSYDSVRRNNHRREESRAPLSPSSREQFRRDDSNTNRRNRHRDHLRGDEDNIVDKSQNERRTESHDNFPINPVVSSFANPFDETPIRPSPVSARELYSSNKFGSLMSMEGNLHPYEQDNVGIHQSLPLSRPTEMKRLDTETDFVIASPFASPRKPNHHKTALVAMHENERFADGSQHVSREPRDQRQQRPGIGSPSSHSHVVRNKSNNASANSRSRGDLGLDLELERKTGKKLEENETKNENGFTWDISPLEVRQELLNYSTQSSDRETFSRSSRTRISGVIDDEREILNYTFKCNATNDGADALDGVHYETRNDEQVDASHFTSYPLLKGQRVLLATADSQYVGANDLDIDFFDPFFDYQGHNQSQDQDQQLEDHFVHDHEQDNVKPTDLTEDEILQYRFKCVEEDETEYYTQNQDPY